jgi:hypothetical protein
MHSSVLGHLDCFQSLAVVNGAAINMGVKWLCHIPVYIPSDICPRVVSLGLMAVLFVLFEGPPYFFPLTVEITCIPTNSIQVFLFPYILSSICCMCY